LLSNPVPHKSTSADPLLAAAAPTSSCKEIHPCEHFVQFYEAESTLLEAIHDYAIQGLQTGAAAVLIATRAHLNALEERWTAEGFDLQAAREQGRYVALDAEETLERLLLDGWPQIKRFATVVEPIITTALGHSRRVIAFGEMVALLWQRAQHDAAIHLEELWNGLAQKYPFALFCAYPLARSEHLPAEALRRVCTAHERTISTERRAYRLERALADQIQARAALRASESLLHTETDALAKLNELSTRLWRAQTLAEGLNEMLGALIELVGAEKGDIQLLDRESGILRIAAHRGFNQDFLDFFREVSLDSDCACGRALRSGQRIIIEDVETDSSSEALRPIARAADFRAVISTPLLSADDTLLGVASTHFRRPRRPTLQQLRRLDLYVRQASGFIQRCSMEQTLRESERALREADQRKDEFLALLAHELRNPLAPIRYALSAARKAGCTAKQTLRAEEIIDRQISHMSRLLDDLLDVSRITRGTLELKKCQTGLTPVLDAAIEAARPILETKRHTLALQLPAEPVLIEADPVRLAQVFSNLLINAGKYTDAGGRIELSVEPAIREILVRVRDNGIGISGEMMTRLFTMFSQAEGALARAEGGLGIGLALARGLVELHGGTIVANSAGSNRGSEFIVRLPLSDNSTHRDAGRRDAAPLQRSSLRVLVADDNRDSAASCGAFLELCGHHVRTAYSGQDALAVADDFRPDVMLLDIGMPGMDGYEVARRARGTSWGEHTTLIAVTGWGQERDRQRAVAAGFDHHLTKPVDPSALEPLLQQLAQRVPYNRSPASPKPGRI
jgi:signal transduction histidine kinase/ActR/RegA family two-component response regulator